MATRRTPKAKVEERGGKKYYGPYKGSKSSNGRPVTVVRNADGSTTSTSSARHEKEKQLGKELPRNVDVAHKREGSNKPTSASSTRVETTKKNRGDGNRARAKKGSKK
jgi:hypothetical protein